MAILQVESQLSSDSNRARKIIYCMYICLLLLSCHSDKPYIPEPLPDILLYSQAACGTGSRKRKADRDVEIHSPCGKDCASDG